MGCTTVSIPNYGLGWLSTTLFLTRCSRTTPPTKLTSPHSSWTRAIFFLCLYRHLWCNSHFISYTSKGTMVYGYRCYLTYDWQRGALMSYFNLSNNNKIMIGNWNSIHIHGYGHIVLPHSYPSLSLQNVLQASHLIKTLIFDFQLIIDNNISMEFDSFSFMLRIFKQGFYSWGVTVWAIFILSPVSLHVIFLLLHLLLLSVLQFFTHL